MANLNELQEEWQRDCEIDETNLGHCSATVPMLHGKWVQYLSKAKLQHRMQKVKWLKLRADKVKYYKGEMTRDELAERGWQQYQGIKPLKSEMNEVLMMDSDLIALEDKVVYQETLIAFLEAVMKSISSRTWDIKNAIEWSKIQNGII